MTPPAPSPDLVAKSRRAYRPGLRHRGRYISYLRVSTNRQEYGLEAQREAVQRFLNGGDWKLLREYCEKESGARNDRPELHRALKHCELTGATLIIAKIDRLTRNVAFISWLLESGIDFVACDFPHANKLTIHILAAVAEYEREMISKRTKEGLAVARQKGVKLGNPRATSVLRRAGVAERGRKRAASVLRAKATARAEGLREVIEDIRAAGITSLEGIARELNERGIRTEREYKGRESRWHAATVRNLLHRLGRAQRNDDDSDVRSKRNG